MFFCYFQPVLEPCGQTAEKNTQSAPKWSYFRIFGPFPEAKKGRGKNLKQILKSPETGHSLTLCLRMEKVMVAPFVIFLFHQLCLRFIF